MPGKIDGGDLDGGSGDTGPPAGGGVPGTGTGTSGVPTGLPVGENGGVFGSTYYLFMPVQDIRSGNCYIGFFDISSFDDPIDSSFYSYRQEDIMRYKVPTVHHVRLVYRDLGLAKINIKLSAVNDLGQTITSTVVYQLGNKIATNALLTAIVDMSITGYRPQLSWARAAASGPVCITSATIEGEVEDA